MGPRGWVPREDQGSQRADPGLGGRPATGHIGQVISAYEGRGRGRGRGKGVPCTEPTNFNTGAQNGQPTSIR